MSRVGKVEDKFCELMARGWVAGAKEITLPDLPGFHCISIEDGDWRLLDAYQTVSTSSYSWGFTALWFDGAPALSMSYQGMYERIALAPLKGVLREAYERGQFHGGRGPRKRDMGAFSYENVLTNDHANGCFGGREEIHFHPQGRKGVITRVGYHEYSGLIY